MAENSSISGSERAAIFLMSLSEHEAAEIMKHMPTRGGVATISEALAV
jgi:flagellar motor switch protein FliG